MKSSVWSLIIACLKVGNLASIVSVASSNTVSSPASGSGSSSGVVSSSSTSSKSDSFSSEGILVSNISTCSPSKSSKTPWWYLFAGKYKITPLGSSFIS